MSANPKLRPILRPVTDAGVSIIGAGEVLSQFVGTLQALAIRNRRPLTVNETVDLIRETARMDFYISPEMARKQQIVMARRLVQEDRQALLTTGQPLYVKLEVMAHAVGMGLSSLERFEEEGFIDLSYRKGWHPNKLRREQEDD